MLAYEFNGFSFRGGLHSLVFWGDYVSFVVRVTNRFRVVGVYR